MGKTAFVDGDWADFHSKKFQNSEFLQTDDVCVGKYDIIFGSDIQYETRNYSNILKLIEVNLAKDGVGIITSKAYYYGNGGSIAEFKQHLEATSLEYVCVKQIMSGISNRREIFIVKFKS